MLSGITQYEDFLDLEIYTHQCLQRAYMFKYKVNDAEKKEKIG